MDISFKRQLLQARSSAGHTHTSSVACTDKVQDVQYNYVCTIMYNDKIIAWVHRLPNYVDPLTLTSTQHSYVCGKVNTILSTSLQARHTMMD